MERVWRCEGDDVIRVEANANGLANRMVMMAWHQCEQGRPAWQPERVEELRAPERLANDLRMHRARVVVDHVVGAQKPQWKIYLYNAAQRLCTSLDPTGAYCLV